MNSLYFGPNRLFGALHPAQSAIARTTAVLLCNPFGEEAIRAHRIYRVLATRLSRAGYPVLRFDYSGTGDSSGEADGAALTNWIDDVASATAELRRASGTQRIAALGLGLGGTLAALAAARHSLGLHHLLMWDPIVDGAAYLRELAAAHVEYMSDEMGAPHPGPKMNADGYPEEALGHPLSRQLVSELAKLDLAALEQLRADNVTVVTTRPSAETKRFEERVARAARSKWIATSSSVPWNSDAAVNAAVVPTDIVEKLITRIEEIGA